MDNYIGDDLLKELSEGDPELKHLSNISSELRNNSAWNKSIESRLFDTNEKLDNMSKDMAFYFTTRLQKETADKSNKIMLMVIIAFLVLILIILFVYLYGIFNL